MFWDIPELGKGKSNVLLLNILYLLQTRVISYVYMYLHLTKEPSDLQLALCTVSYLHRLFITHGGLQSMQEAVYHGVPLIGIPLVWDQGANIELGKRHGFALDIDLLTISEKVILETVRKILHDEQ